MEDIKSNKPDIIAKDNSSLKRIGNFIKEARLNRNQSIEELAYDLKLGTHQLKAIEDGNEEFLPEEVFVKAMVRRISDKLKLDTKYIMAEFNSEREEVNIEDIDKEVANKSKGKKQPKNLNYIGFGIFVLISGFFGLTTSYLILNFFSESLQNQPPTEEVIKEN